LRKWLQVTVSNTLAKACLPELMNGNRLNFRRKPKD
jgi:hypothetical protein